MYTTTSTHLHKVNKLFDQSHIVEVEHNGISIDHIANLQNDAWWEGARDAFDALLEGKGKICAINLPTMHHSWD